jgi:YidC/Oxa1 family membrane protein insertase
MKSEDTRNLFLAIALSVLVMAAWQYFYAGPLYQREHQSQTQANTAAPVSGAAPSGAGRFDPGGRFAAWRPSAERRRDGRRGFGGESARHD